MAKKKKKPPLKPLTRKGRVPKFKPDPEHVKRVKKRKKA